MQGYYAIVKQEYRLLKQDLSALVVLFIMPLLTLILMAPAMGAMLREQGVIKAQGVELALPAMTIMFGTLGAAFLGFSFFREQQWQSWQRLRASPTSLWVILVAKISLPLMLLWCQQLFLLSSVLVVYQPDLMLATLQQIELLLAYCTIGFLYSLNVISIGLLAAAFCHNVQQMNAFIHVIALLLVASSCAFIPQTQLPDILSHFVVFTPSFWMVEAQVGLLFNQRTLTSLIPIYCSAFLLSFILFLFGLNKFRQDERKR